MKYIKKRPVLLGFIIGLIICVAWNVAVAEEAIPRDHKLFSARCVFEDIDFERYEEEGELRFNSRLMRDGELQEDFLIPAVHRLTAKTTYSTAGIYPHWHKELKLENVADLSIDELRSKHKEVKATPRYKELRTWYENNLHRELCEFALEVQLEYHNYLVSQKRLLK